MKPLSITRLALAATMACTFSVQAQQAPTSPPPTMSTQEYSAARERINADYKAARAACDKLTANAKDICVEEAKGKERVADAELQYQRSGQPGDAQKVALAKAEADYEVAKERCDDLKGNDKDTCRKEAKAAEARAKADAKAMHKS